MAPTGRPRGRPKKVGVASSAANSRPTCKSFNCLPIYPSRWRCILTILEIAARRASGKLSTNTPTVPLTTHPSGPSSLNDDEDDDEFGDEDEEDSDDDDSHPLQQQAQDLALRAMDLIRREDGPGTPSYKLISSLLQVSGKLAGALNGRGSGYEPETGFVLAVLKRCLNWLNDAVGACQELIALEKDPDHRMALEHLRTSAFKIRDSIVELRRELK